MQAALIILFNMYKAKKKISPSIIKDILISYKPQQRLKLSQLVYIRPKLASVGFGNIIKLDINVKQKLQIHTKIDVESRLQGMHGKADEVTTNTFTNSSITYNTEIIYWNKIECIGSSPLWLYMAGLKWV